MEPEGSVFTGTGNTHCTGRLHPGFSINLHGKCFCGAVRGQGRLVEISLPMEYQSSVS